MFQGQAWEAMYMHKKRNEQKEILLDKSAVESSTEEAQNSQGFFSACFPCFYKKKESKGILNDQLVLLEDNETEKNTSPKKS